MMVEVEEWDGKKGRWDEEKEGKWGEEKEEGGKLVSITKISHRVRVVVAIPLHHRQSRTGNFTQSPVAVT